MKITVVCPKCECKVPLTLERIEAEKEESSEQPTIIFRDND